MKIFNKENKEKIKEKVVLVECMAKGAALGLYDAVTENLAVSCFILTAALVILDKKNK